jgi:hypothetical protein
MQLGQPRESHLGRGGGLLMMRADDALKYAAAVAAQRINGALDGICGSDICDGHEDESDRIWRAVNDIRSLAAEFGDANRYSDGRSVVTRAEICFGYYAEHIWHPDPAVASPSSWRGSLPSDPDVPSPGIYEVSTDPATQQIHVRVVRLSVIENHDRSGMDDAGEVGGDE